MKHKTQIFFVLVGLIFLLSQPSSAQHWVYLSISQNTYIGDLNPLTGSFYNPSSFKGQLGYGIGYERSFDENVHWFVDINIGEYEGAYSLRSTVDRIVFAQNASVRRNEYIFGSYKAIQLGFNWTYFKTKWVDLNTGLGIGLMDFTVKDLNGSVLSDVDVTRAEGENYSNLITTLPLKAGFVFFPNSSFNLVFEISWHFMNTDYLDNIGEYGKPGSDALFKNLVQVRYKL